MAKQQFFVLAKSLWQGDAFSPIAVFPTRKEAQAFASEKESNGVNEYGQQNLKNVVETLVLSKTKMKQICKIDEETAHEAIAYIAYNESFTQG